MTSVISSKEGEGSMIGKQECEDKESLTREMKRRWMSDKKSKQISLIDRKSEGKRVKRK